MRPDFGNLFLSSTSFLVRLLWENALESRKGGRFYQDVSTKSFGLVPTLCKATSLHPDKFVLLDYGWLPKTGLLIVFF